MPKATTAQEPVYAGEYILSELPNLSRDQRIVSAGTHVPGTVMAQVTASKELVALDPAAATGAEVAVAVLYDHADASVAAVPAVVSARLTAVRATDLVWPAGITDPQKTTALAQLASQHIIAR